MKAAEITDRLIAELRTGRFRHARLNYANGDMVGHTGDRDAAVIAVEAVDLQLGRLLPVIAKLGGALIVTADHGNCDEMFERGRDGAIALDEAGHPKPKTSHTLNRVPFYVYAPGARVALSNARGGAGPREPRGDRAPAARLRGARGLRAVAAGVGWANGDVCPPYGRGLTRRVGKLRLAHRPSPRHARVAQRRAPTLPASSRSGVSTYS